MKLRPAVKQFAEEMERVLQHAQSYNDRHWRFCGNDYLAQRLFDEIGELMSLLIGEKEAVVNYEDSALRECCDVANFAMMIADNVSMRKEREANRQKEQGNERT